MEQKLSNVLNVSFTKFNKEHKNVLNQGDLQSIAKFIEMINNNYPDKIVDDKQTDYFYNGFEIEGVSHNFNPAEKEIKSFLFETEDEAIKAYHQFERDEKNEWIGEIVGWWYGRKDFEKKVKEYETENDGYSKVLTHWLVS